jgi:hypothetical protein
MPEPYFFISYASKDRPRMEQVVDALREATIPLWVDVQGLRNGDKWLRELEKHITECVGVVVLMSIAGRESEWVEREVLLALDLKKPIFIARFDQVPLPLHLINRQFTPFEDDFAHAIRRFIGTLEAVLAGSDNLEQLTHAVLPNESNFFAYLQQMPNGNILEMVARDLFAWGKKHTDDVSFSGKYNPTLNAKVKLPDGTDVTLFSVVAYLRNPSVTIALDQLTKFPPYNQISEQRALLQQLSDLLPSATFDAERKRPSLPLKSALSGGENLEAFKDIISTILAKLRQHATA